jgi:hypothetical protein
MKYAMPFFKRYQLRWLFYRKGNNNFFVQSHQSEHRCKVCKKGRGMLMHFDGKSYCPAGHVYVEEKNTNFNHMVWKINKKVSSAFWFVLDKIHLVRSNRPRYDLFGDESKYVDRWIINFETGATRTILKKRKWWEYIFIERSKFNF